MVKPERVDVADALSLDVAVRAVPKLHLHCHLEGTLRPQTFLELVERDGISTRYDPSSDSAPGPRDVESVYRFTDFADFLLTFAAVCRALRRPEDYARLVREFVADASERNVIYGELFVSPSVWHYFHPELDMRQALAAIAQELRAARTGTFSLIVDVTRNFGVHSAMRTAELAASSGDAGVIGIGMGGDEAAYPAELFPDVFAYARAQGLHAVAHAGEAAGASSVRVAVEVLGAERIGHGVRALEDPSLVEMLAQRRIPLEICPTSNFLTGAAARERPHPLLALDAAGVPIVIDADDPALFGTSIEQEYRYVAEIAGPAALARFVEDAVEASFAPPECKRVLRERVGPELAALRRSAGNDAAS